MSGEDVCRGRVCQTEFGEYLWELSPKYPPCVSESDRGRVFRWIGSLAHVRAFARKDSEESQADAGAQSAGMNAAQWSRNRIVGEAIASLQSAAGKI